MAASHNKFFTSAALAILANEWGKRTALAMGFYEISTGLGMIIGPLLGGWLYDVGGFGLPFWVVGTIMFVGAILNYFTVPKVRQVPKITFMIDFIRLMTNQ